MAERWRQRWSQAPSGVGRWNGVGRWQGGRFGVGLGVGLALVALLLLAGVWWLVDTGVGRVEAAFAPATSARPTKVDVAGLPADSQVVRVGVGATSACLLTEAGRVYCWGSNEDGQLGRAGGSAGSPVPVDVSGALAGAKLTRITVGDRHACAVDTQGRVFCWGANEDGQLGTSKTGQGSAVPVQVQAEGALAGRHVAFVTAGGASTCATDDTGAVFCWGANDAGQLGDGTVRDSPVPVRVGQGGELATLKVVSLAVGDRHACVVTDGSRAYCWGGNDHGQLGTGGTSDAPSPQRVSFADVGRPEAVSAGGATTCAQLAGGGLACWGAGEHGQLGTGERSDSHVPARAQLSEVWRLNVGGTGACAIGRSEGDQRLYCWGAGDQGQLGTGTATDSAEPVRVRRPSVAWERVNGSDATTCAVDSSGTAWCWGSDANGLLGDG